MLEKIKTLLNMDEPVLKIVRFGLKLSIIICTIAILSLLTYYKFYISHDLYEGSVILFRTGLLFAVQFFICGIAINKIKNDF